ncbi:MAG: NAD(P)H-quinone oxidoreductase [Myxococcaceae bacterium]|nr:NAD(P)H-quinone oxidoreductase [Myxococcaceae bacterium]
MRAYCIRGAGGPEVLKLEERPAPRPGPEEVRVRVRAAALNRADLLQMRGYYAPPPGVPVDIPGLEYAGEVVEVGARVTGLSPGAHVMGLVGGGAFAEELVTHERETLPVPPGLTLAQAAAIPEAFLTAHDALFLQGGLRGTERVLIHAVTSGVGSAAAQLAAAAGATVVGTGRSEAKLARAAAWGVHHVVHVTSGPPTFAAAVRERVGAVDVVLDLVGGPYLPETLEALAPRARYLLVGLLAGPVAELPLRTLLNRRVTLTGTVLRSRPLEEKIALARDFERTALPRFASGQLAPVVDSILPMEELPRAAARMASDDTVGKLVLTW